VKLNPKSLFENIENVNYAIACLKKMDIVMINIGWIDIVNGNRKIIFGILFQLMNRYSLTEIRNLRRESYKERDGEREDVDEEGEGEEMTDMHVMRWAKAKVALAATGKLSLTKLSTLLDTDSLFLIELIG
jgi:hypothetical protein